MAVTLEVRGPARGRVRALVRPDLFSFQVLSPSGRFADCQLPAPRVSPLREFFVTLGRERIRFDLARICSPEVFVEPGVYQITPVFRPTFDGRDVGLTAWTGRIEGEAFLARVRRVGRGGHVAVEIIGPDGARGGGEADAR